MIVGDYEREIRHFHLFCGLGGGAKGFNRGTARVGNSHAKFRCVGGVDVDKAAIADFGRLAGVNGTVLDMFSRDQYTAFHGHEPPAGWREATPADMHRAAHYEQPHIGFGSAPCKGFSGLLSESRSGSAKYQALNQLALRGLWLALEAWKDDPLEFWLWENVPRIATRGRAVLDQMIRLLEAYGYVVAETTHDCGELGGLGQRRKRFLLVARHVAKVPPFLYEPPKRPLRSVGDIIGRLPMPGPDMVLPMHRLPSLQWQTWVRLAFVEAGGDWRSLNKLRVADGVLRDFRLMPETTWYRTALGVMPWTAAGNTVTSEARPSNGAFSVADTRTGYTGDYHQIGVRSWVEPSGVISGQMQVGGGPHSIADVRYGDGGLGAHHGKMRVEHYDDPAHVVTASDRVGSGALSIADPRPEQVSNRPAYGVCDIDDTMGTVIGYRAPGQGTCSIADPRIHGAPRFNHVFRVVPWSEQAPAVTGGGGPAGGPAVADPRVGLKRDAGASFQDAGGAYGVLPMDSPSGAVVAAASHDNGRWTVADHRYGRGGDDDPVASLGPVLPGATDRIVALIIASDGTYHRPLTTLELAALQSLVDPDEILELEGGSDSAHRERIGNAVPPDAAQSIASVMGQTLLLAWAGESFQLSASPIWVRPLVIALSVDAPLLPA